MNELPPWIVLRDTASMPAQVLRELWGNPQFVQHVTAAMAPADRFPFAVHVGGRPLFEEIAQGRTSWDAEGGATGAATIFNAPSPNEPVTQAGMAFDVDRILAAAGGDSAQAREMVRDAFLHEFGHVLPVARSRNLSDRTGDPRPGVRNVMDHPVIQGENELRGLLGLEPKQFYGLLNRTP